MEIDFRLGGNSESFELSGFSVPEELGTWMVGPRSEIVLPAAGFTAETFGFALSLVPFTLGSRIPAQALIIEVNGTRVWDRAVTDWTEISLQLPTAMLVKQPYTTFAFWHLGAASPASVSESTDTRELSFLVRRLMISGRDLYRQSPQAQQIGAVLTDNLPPKTASVAQTPHDIHRGKDDWLFLIGGSNDVLRFYTDPTYFAAAHSDLWADVLQERGRRLSEIGVKYVHIAAPDKLSVLPEYVTLPLPNLDRHPIALLAAEIKLRKLDHILINPLTLFRADGRGPELYLKTDTHWSYRAAMLVFEMTSSRLGHARSLDLNARDLKYYCLTGDLGGKLDPPKSEQYFAVQTLPGVERFWANELAELFERNVRARRPVIHRGVNVAFRNSREDAIDETVVIFGDSFMDFQPSNTTMIFAENFKEVHFIWSPEIDYAYVKRTGATIVITEFAERFMLTIPRDEYDVEQEATARAANYHAGHPPEARVK